MHVITGISRNEYDDEYSSPLALVCKITCFNI